MRGNLLRALVPVALLALAVALGACGSSSTSGKNGGTLTVLNQGDFEHADPGSSYYQFDFQIHYAADRPLYSYKPAEQKKTPDLAAGEPVISADGKTVTVKIKKGIKFSPPVNREVTSSDVKYAMERAFSANVPNGYVTTYWPLQGAPSKPTTGVQPISGITTPDKNTIVFKLTKAIGAFFAESLVMPATAPVPKEYASKFDKSNPSTYDKHQVATGPYMIKNDKSGTLTGWVPNRKIELVRNPNWVKSTDYRPAKLDAITVLEGNSDTASATKKIFTGSHMVTGDITPPGATLKDATTIYKSQFANPFSGGWRAVMFNTKKKPFDDINVRKATIAGMDKNALRQSRGGPTIGDIAYHFLPPAFPGFQEGGGSSTDQDFMSKPTADSALAAKYFAAAGMKGGKYSGPNASITLTCDNADPGKSVCAVAADQLRGLGFKPAIQSVPHEKMLLICGIPAKQPEVCPNVGWFKDFYDPQTMLQNTFEGSAIVPANNSNWPQLSDPKIDAAMEKAAPLKDPAARAKAWGAIDKMIVAQAPGVPFVWDRQPDAESKDVAGVVSDFLSVWDLSHTALK
ncbi:MAG: peptide/nickel transport system substrate-binding protein [Thermoleophilaceae bacterium]|jgi:peptide/nickel transport system substrate-binding protein|nr:peptide/nickel transport system substrate-binding protein [Thermoleophilaceae bacterium]